MKKLISIFVLLSVTSAFADIDSVNVTVNNHTKNPYWCYEDSTQQAMVGKCTNGW